MELGGGAMIAAVRNYLSDVWEAWNEFWFTPSNPATYSAIRVLAGAMLLYTHLVWSYDLDAFFGPDGWLPPSIHQEVEGLFRQIDNRNRPPQEQPVEPGDSARWNWSYFNHINSATLRWTAHIAALVVFFLLTIGLFSRTMAVLALLATTSYSNRITPGAYFGLDTINSMLAMYLVVGPCGARYSVDRLWRMRRGGPAEPEPSAAANVGIRLIQLHMCVIYLFSGIGKIRGEAWWGGWATWVALANTEYQTWDLTGLGEYPFLINLVTVVTVFWELGYCALIWPRLTRPWMLLMAVLIHAGIVFALGMPTFGLVMLIGNLAFVSPAAVQKVFNPLARRISLAVLGGEGQGSALSPPSRTTTAPQPPTLGLPR
jgi:hypothetical protein